MTILFNDKRFESVSYKTEKDFEDDVAKSSKALFGPRTIFINAKRKIESKSLGGTVPDGYFFDFSDPEDPQFYIVEVELAHHSFYNHIFPQITKFFAFFNDNKLQKNLVDKLYSLIDTDSLLNSEFRKVLGKQEIYKFLSDLVDSSQNILLIADGPIAELQEISDTYTDTWGSLVKFLEIRRYVLGDDSIFTISPDFEAIQYIEPTVVPSPDDEEDEGSIHTEDFHLDRSSPGVREVYAEIKRLALAADPTLRFNPQKYYISIKAKKNIAFLKLRKKKLRFIAMMPEEDIRKLVNQLRVVGLSQAVQDFYNGPCAAVDIPDLTHEQDLQSLMKSLVENHRAA